MDKKCLVKNRSNGGCIYSVNEGGYHIRREFAPGEQKEIPAKELEQLSYSSGGKVLLAEYLQILDEETVQGLGMSVEPEYNMSEQDVIDALKNASLDEFLDILDFAPQGVLDLIKHHAVALPLNDVAKRDAILEKLHFDVGTAIEMSKEEMPAAAAKTPERRVKKDGEASRRAAAPKYKVISE